MTSDDDKAHEYLATQIATMEERMIDPVEFGGLKAEVISMRREMDEMRGDIKTLLGMADRSRGALWAGMSIASFAGAVVTWVAGKIFGH